MSTQTPRRPRGPWAHYICPACADKSGHLGINSQTGAARCLRCGATGSLFKGGGLVRKSPPKRLSLRGDVVVSFDEADAAVDDYMRGRGIALPPSPDTWGYGVGWASGCPVFMARNAAGELTYVQKRTNNPNSRYEALPNTLPAVDVYGAAGKIVVLTEGPISALRVMQDAGIVAKPTWGAEPKTSTLRHIHGSGIKRLVVMFDPDAPGIRGSARVAMLVQMGGTPVSAVEYSPDDMANGLDPADIPKSRLLDLIGSAL